MIFILILFRTEYSTTIAELCLRHFITNQRDRADNINVRTLLTLIALTLIGIRSIYTATIMFEMY